jgi:hypothetical protein
LKFKNNKISLSPNIKEIVKKVRENPNLSLSELGCTQYDYTFAKEVIQSELFVENYKANGNKYLCARLRPGFIGNEISLDDGTSYIQSRRGRPYGSIVAIPNEKGTVTLGISYLKDEPRNHPYPIIGLARALKDAVYRRCNNLEGFPQIKNNENSQIEYFYNRALSYFNPEKYSYSRGKRK